MNFSLMNMGNKSECLLFLSVPLILLFFTFALLIHVTSFTIDSDLIFS